MSRRHALQRSNRVRLKADAVVLLDKIAKSGIDLCILDEIAEMQVRLAPPTGAAAPIKLTGYTDNRSKLKGAPKAPPIDWKAEAVLGLQGFDSMRYRKD